MRNAKAINNNGTWCGNVEKLWYNTYIMANEAEVICAMTRFRNISIRKKILVSMLAFTLIPILLVSIVAITITYKTMRDQLIYDHRMSSGWLQDRLAVENSDMMDRFYEFEVDKDVKADILRWCTQDGSLGLLCPLADHHSHEYSHQYGQQHQFHRIIQSGGRWGADRRTLRRRVDETGDKLAQWELRADELQSNQVFLRDGKKSWHIIRSIGSMINSKLHWLYCTCALIIWKIYWMRLRPFQKRQFWCSMIRMS